MEKTITYETISNTVRSWPQTMRLKLVQDIIVSLNPEGFEIEANPNKQSTLSEALGLLYTGDSTPDDDEIQALLDEHKSTVFGESSEDSTVLDLAYKIEQRRIESGLSMEEMLAGLREQREKYVAKNYAEPNG